MCLFQIPDRNSDSPCGSKVATSDRDLRTSHRLLDEEIEQNCADCLVELHLSTTNLFSRIIGPKQLSSCCSSGSFVHPNRLESDIGSAGQRVPFH